MSEIALSLLIAAVKAFFAEITKALATRIMNRKKERTAPIASRDGSDEH